MSNYVFSGAKCHCAVCPLANGTLRTQNHISAKDGILENQGMVTIDIMPQMNGECNSPLNPTVVAAGGVPQPCQPMWSGNWINTSITHVFCKEKIPLLTGGMLICTYGGVIQIDSPANSVADSLANLHYTSLDDVVYSYSKKLMNARQKTAGTAVSAMAAVNKDSLEKSFQTIQKRAAALQDKQLSLREKMNTKAEKEIDKAKKQAEKAKQEDTSPCTPKEYLCGNIPCPDGLEARCELNQTKPKNQVVLKAENSGTVLGKNMTDSSKCAQAQENKELEDKIRSYQPGEGLECVAAHHHLIPGNECLSTNKELVAMANFYGYNVNRPENGIILPSLQGKKNFSEDDWELAKIKAVRDLGMQLHNGDHEFTGKISESLMFSETEFFDYEHIVNSKLLALQNKMVNDFQAQSSCRMKNRDAEKEEFHKRMDALSQELREAVLGEENDFGTGKDGKPYVSYVSMVCDLNQDKTPEEILQIMKGKA